MMQEDMDERWNELVDHAIEAAAMLLEVELVAQEEELQAIIMMMGNAGGMLMVAMEDGIDMADQDVLGAAWESVEVDIEGYRLMGDPSFKLHYRMRKQTYELLLEAIANHLVNENRIQRVRTPLDVVLLMVLWIMANPDTFRSVALRFGVRPGTLHFHYCYIIEALREMAPNYIQWPTEEERAQIAARFQNATGFSGVVGCIDCTHNYITVPLHQPVRYLNRHHTFSLNTQAVCDDTLLVRDLYVGEVGSMHDARVFRRSPLSRNLLHNEGMLDEDQHILGDGAYPLRGYLLTPFRNNAHLTAEQHRYNRTLSRCRVRIENAFGKAKGQWRRMKRMHSINMELAVDHVVSSFVLHNFMILNGEVLHDWQDPYFDFDEEDEVGDDGQQESDEEEGGENDDQEDDALIDAAARRGQQKRNYIMNNLPN